MHKSYKDGGLDWRRYEIFEDGERLNGYYFILEPFKDFHAKVALLIYADSVEEENPKLADDIRRELA